MENGYAIWDFRGQEIRKHIQDRFKQFLWRPRPRTLLTKDQQRKIRKNLKEYSRTFDEEDAAEESNVSAELIAQRKRLVDEWNAWRAKCRKELGEERAGSKSRSAEVSLLVGDVQNDMLMIYFRTMTRRKLLSSLRRCWRRLRRLSRSRVVWLVWSLYVCVCVCVYYCDM